MKSANAAKNNRQTADAQNGAKTSRHPVQLLQSRHVGNPFQFFTGVPVSQPGYNPLQLLAHAAGNRSVQQVAEASTTAVAPVQRVLADVGVFQSDTEIIETGSTEAYLIKYAAIREAAVFYNSTCEAREVMDRLHQLENLQTKINGCIRDITEGAYPETNPAHEHQKHLNALSKAINQEKTDVVRDKTTEKNILARTDGVIKEGTRWEVLKDEWLDASSLIKGTKTVRYTILSEDDTHYFIRLKGVDAKARMLKGDVLDDQYKVSEAPLYPRGSPVKEDVLQTNLGDCYLQAALAGLAAKDPAFIKGMLFDNGPEVVVRLFRLPERSPQYLRVPRSTAKDSEGNDLYNNSALWVKMIQKAYAAGNFAGNLSGKRQFFSIKDIEGDMIGYTMGVLTGKEVAAHKASGASLQDVPDMNNGTPWAFDIGDMWDVIQDLSGFPEEKEQQEKCASALGILTPIFGETFALIKEWAGFVEEGDNRGKLEECKKVEDFTTFFEDKELNEEIKQRITGWVTESGLYRGAVGTGIYSQGQMAVLVKLEEALRTGKLVSTATEKELSDDSSEGSGHSGEPKYKGLVGGHAYSVLDLRMNKTRDPQSDEAGNIHWVQLRNPWGEYGRTYNEHWEAQATEEGGGVFWIELSDMADNFQDFEIV